MKRRTGLFHVYLTPGLFVILVALFLPACAYRLGGPPRALPGGYRQVYIPIFKNLTQEPGIEVGFTNSLIQEFERSRSARVVSPQYAEAQVEGEITSVQYIMGGSNEGRPDGPLPLPTGSVLAAEYRILLNVRVTLRRKSDNAQLWQGSFQGERTYVAPQVTQAGINTVNPLYNLSARRQNIDSMAVDLMAEAHDRMSENF